jgi:hypothetical protein
MCQYIYIRCSISEFLIMSAYFIQFQMVFMNVAIHVIHQLPYESCATDPMPTFLLKAVATDFAPVELFSCSLQSGCVCLLYKAACVNTTF